MPDDTTTEEHKQKVKEIIQRWHFLGLVWYLVYFVILIYVLCFLPNSGSLLAEIRFLLAVFSFPFFYYYTSVWTIKFILWRIPRHERESLAFIPNQLLKDSDKRILSKALKKYHIVPRQEYLRASTEPQDDTLLRPAAHNTDNSPQEQFLRPADKTGS